MRDQRNYRDPAPHFDGKYEGPIKASEGPQMGIKIDADPLMKKNPNPYHLANVKHEIFKNE